MPQLIVDLGRVLYLGPWTDTAVHTPMVTIVGAGLDGEIVLYLDDAELRGRTVLIGGGIPHSVDAFGGRLAVMPIDPLQAPESIDEPRTLDALNALANAEQFSTTLWDDLGNAVGLQQLDEVSDHVREAARLILATHDTNVPGARIAAEVGYSLSHLQDLFRTQLGVSMRSYRTWARLCEVARLMASASTLTETAVAAGFYDSAHFTNTFVETFGVTPTSVFTDDLKIHVVTDRLLEAST